ncbi:MAG TPA: TolC family protein, partial [Saprospiraceae bacterium]|nr:TolC family protein [Saprospiraceae bacterium]
RIDWNVNFGSSFNNVNQSFIDGRNINRFGRSVAPNSNVALSWTLFDGSRGKTRYSILQAQSDRSLLTVQDTEDFLEYQVSIAYYTIAKQKETISFLQTIIKYYEERVKITQERWQIGRGSKLDYLQSQNDLNAQVAAIQTAQIVLDNQKVVFNLLLGREADELFDTEAVVPKLDETAKDGLLKMALENDEAIKLIDKDLIINDLRVKELQGAKLPTISLNTAFGYSLSNTNAGLILLNQNLGLSVGITSTWNIYDGHQNRKQTEIAAFRSDIIARQKEATISSIKSEISVAVNQLVATKKLLEVEETNKTIAEENLQISLEKFRLGGSTILDLNEAQQRYDAALNRYVDAYYDVRFAELEIERISK